MLNELLEEMDSRCFGFVLMPDHVHAILWFPQVGQLSRFMHEWKQRASLNIRKWYRSAADHYAARFGEGDRFWQPKYYSFEISGRQKLEEKLGYMHLNPERAGLVKRALDWRWSSARWYEWGGVWEFPFVGWTVTDGRLRDDREKARPLVPRHTGRVQSDPTGATPPRILR